MLWGSDGRDGYWSYWMGEVVAFVLSWPTRFCLSSVSVDLPPPAVKPLPPATCHTCHKKVTGTGGTSASSRTRQDSICFHHTIRLPSRASRPLCVCPTATPIDVPQWQPSSKGTTTKLVSIARGIPQWFRHCTATPRDPALHYPTMRQRTSSPPLFGLSSRTETLQSLKIGIYYAVKAWSRLRLGIWAHADTAGREKYPEPAGYK